MRKLLFLIISVLAISAVSALEFNSTILDSGIVYTNPAVAIDSTGIKHIVYSDFDNLIYINSADNYKTEKILYSGSQISNPTIAIDSKDNIHIAFKEVGSFAPVYYLNSKDWIVKPLNIGYDGSSQVSIILDSNDKLYIASEKYYDSTDVDIVITSSTDYENFDLINIPKNGYQMNPVLAVSGDVIHLIYYDWSDGIGTNSNGEGVGLYKTRYRSSEDNFATEQNISDADRSYGADMQVDKNGDVWVTFKDSTQDYAGEEFGSGVVQLADKNSNWTKQEIQGLTSFMQDRPLSLAIGEDGVRNVAWTEMNYTPQTGYGNEVSVMYARVNSPAVVTLQDVGYDPSLGYVDIAMDTNDPYIVANIHSLADYSVLDETPQINLTDLQNQINNLTNQLNELSLTCSQTNQRLTQLENRTTAIESIINAMRTFPTFSDFWNYFGSPDKCINNQFQCSGNNTQKCVNYRWINNQTCLNGCTNGVCNKEDCTKKPSTAVCRYTTYSVVSGYKCAYKQGTNTACNAGQCVPGGETWNYCSKGCNVTNGLCKV